MTHSTQNPPGINPTDTRDPYKAVAGALRGPNQRAKVHLNTHKTPFNAHKNPLKAFRLSALKRILHPSPPGSPFLPHTRYAAGFAMP
jgi:hypothetical protein